MNSQPANIQIRFAQKNDAPVILDLIRELAIFEKAPEAVTNTLEEIERDGFGENPAFKCLIAEWKARPEDPFEQAEVAGISLYYIRYSTWKGRILYLEDLIVREKHRGNGIGKSLLERTLQEAKKLGVNGTRWQVLDWNEPAIEFYKKYNCTFDGEWINCNMDKEQLKKALQAE